MKKLLSFGTMMIMGFTLVNAQVITSDPAFPTADDEVVITFYANEGSGGLAGYTGDVYAHTGVLTSNSSNGSDWRYVIADWTENIEKAKLTRVADDTYELTISPTVRDFYGVPENETITDIALVFRASDGSREGKTENGSDIFLEISEGGFQLKLNSPTEPSQLVDTNDELAISASTSENANFELIINEVTIDTQSGISNYDYTHTITETSGTSMVTLRASTNDETAEESFTYTIRSSTIEETRPAGLIKGINYHSDPTKATLVLHAPRKSSVYVIGDFNEWSLGSSYQMKKDGDYFWLELTDLSPKQEYAFQYVVDETIYIADTYADKILHPDDRFISNEIYPDLKEYPSGADNSNVHYRTAAVLQTDQDEYSWGDQNFERHDPEKLVVYELLIRDFFENGEETYANLTDTLSYIKSLGVNTIELMPVTEFAGNDSWGYNPTFMFAPDKAYGPKNELKKFIDTAHQMGFSVILDMVLNHHDVPNPLLLLDFDFDRFLPSDDNPYFNNSGSGENGAPHDFSVFFDFNHTKDLTQQYVDSVNWYWLNEYHFDGYRFDLTKGFMQNGPRDGYAYNAERIAILKRMADDIWSHTPGAYVILEHFTDNTEEKELTDYGMMTWANMHWSYKQNILGYSSDSDISWTYHGNRGWNNAHAIGYMESHDEERQMFEAVEYGNSTTDYNVKDEENALERIASSSAMLYLIPGPKMIWQFGELGYEIEIDYNGRTGQKPVPWNGVEGLDYNNDPERINLRFYISEIFKLKTMYSVFNTGNASIMGGTSLNKQIVLINEANTDNPSSPDEMNAVIVANFNTTSSTIEVAFPHDGIWFDYFSGISYTSSTLQLNPGDFKIFTDFELDGPDIITSIEDENLSNRLTVYPNPASDMVRVTSDTELVYYFIYSLNGQLVKKGKFKNEMANISELSPGSYVMETISRMGKRDFQRLIKE